MPSRARARSLSRPRYASKSTSTRTRSPTPEPVTVPETQEHPKPEPADTDKPLPPLPPLPRLFNLPNLSAALLDLFRKPAGHVEREVVRVWGCEAPGVDHIYWDGICLSCNAWQPGEWDGRHAGVPESEFLLGFASESEDEYEVVNYNHVRRRVRVEAAEGEGLREGPGETQIVKSAISVESVKTFRSVKIVSPTGHDHCERQSSGESEPKRRPKRRRSRSAGINDS